MENKLTNDKKETLSQEELLKIACDKFARKLKTSDYKLTYDGTGKIIACR